MAHTYEKLRAILAESNRDIASSRRLIDDIPQGPELVQYDRRLQELHRQVRRRMFLDSHVVLASPQQNKNLFSHCWVFSL